MVFFSGTDWSELEDNAPNHNYYLSLIVNNFMDFCAKVCFIAEAKDEVFTFESKDEEGIRYAAQTGTYSVPPKLIVYDCVIESPKKTIEVQEDFTQKVKSIIQKAEVASTPKNYSIKPMEKDGESWSNFSNSSNKKSTDWTSRKDTLADAIEEDIEEFTMFVINAGAPIEEFKTVEDICDYYASFNVTGKMVAGKVADTFVDSYTTFFSQFQDEFKNDTLLEKALDEVIMELDHVVRTTRYKLVENMLKPSIEILEKIKENFNTKELS